MTLGFKGAIVVIKLAFVLCYRLSCLCEFSDKEASQIVKSVLLGLVYGSGEGAGGRAQREVAFYYLASPRSPPA